MDKTPINLVQLDSDKDERNLGRHQWAKVNPPLLPSSTGVYRLHKTTCTTSTTPSNKLSGTESSLKKLDSNPNKIPIAGIIKNCPQNILPQTVKPDKTSEFRVRPGTPSNNIRTVIKVTTKTPPNPNNQQIFLVPLEKFPKVILMQADRTENTTPGELATVKKTVVKKLPNEQIVQKPKEQSTVSEPVIRKSINEQFVQLIPIQDTQKLSTGQISTTSQNFVREERVYVKEIKEQIENKIDGETKKLQMNLRSHKEIECQDPLYIPEMQETVSSPMESKRSRTPKPKPKTQRSSVSQYSPTKTRNIQNKINTVTPIVSLTEPINSEHLVVRNYSLLNKVTATKKTLRSRSKSVPARRPKTATKKVVNNFCISGNISVKPVGCRTFYIKNSAWEFIERDFNGFNEREIDISKKCSETFDNLMRRLKINIPEEKEDTYLKPEDLYYTRKIELLNPQGKRNKIYYVPEHKENKRKRKAKPVYKLPETKKCKVVLQRDEKVENILKRHLLLETLNSNLCNQLGISKGSANKPLIILNRINFNVLKVNETLCQYANIIYVKNEDEGFPEKLFKNEFIVSKLKNKTIKIVTPAALKNYFT